MANLGGRTPNRKVLLVYYSPDARRRLEEVIRAQHLEVYSINGRASDALNKARKHTARVVIMDHSADDVSITQAIRQIGQVLPNSAVFTVSPGREAVDIYRKGHRIATVANVEWALQLFAFNRDVISYKQE